MVLEKNKMFINQEKGFTLVELMVVVALSTIIIVAIYSAYIIQQRTYYSQDQVIEMQQNIRAGLDMMTREIRMAGYDPTESNNPAISITAASNNSITFTMDLDEDGATGGTNETITYTLSGTNLTRRVGAGAPQPIAENIEQIEFFYTLADDSQTTTPGTLDDIRSIRISLLAIASQRDAKYTNDGNYTTGSGGQWGPFDDNFRRRLLVTTVQCRNMGL